jgi:hypothetical protein
MPLPGQESPEENYASHVIAAGQEANDLLNAENPWLPETLESLQMINKTPASANSAITALKRRGNSYLSKDVLAKLLEKAIHIKTEDSQIQKLLSATNTPLRTSNSLLFKKTTVSPLNRIALSNNHNNNNNDFSINNNEIQRPIMPPFANAQAAANAKKAAAANAQKVLNAFETRTAAKAASVNSNVGNAHVKLYQSIKALKALKARKEANLARRDPNTMQPRKLSAEDPASVASSRASSFTTGGKHRSHKKNKKHNNRTKRLRRRS